MCSSQEFHVELKGSNFACVCVLYWAYMVETFRPFEYHIWRREVSRVFSMLFWISAASDAFAPTGRYASGSGFFRHLA